MIEMSTTHSSPETLGAFLARIRPGDRCACCGGVLRPLDRGARVGRNAEGLSALGPAEGVYCPDCGSEIFEEAGPEAEDGLSWLSPAA